MIFLLVNIILSCIGATNGSDLVSIQPKCNPTDTNCRDNYYQIYESPLTIQSDSRFNLEYYHFYNNSLSLKDRMIYRIDWRTFELSGNFLECEKDSLTVFIG